MKCEERRFPISSRCEMGAGAGGKFAGEVKRKKRRPRRGVGGGRPYPARLLLG